MVDGQVLRARFRHAERAAEAPAYRTWFEDNKVGNFHPSTVHNEGEGDFAAVVQVILAGTGFRTDYAAHAEASRRDSAISRVAECFLGNVVVAREAVGLIGQLESRGYRPVTALTES